MYKGKCENCDSRLFVQVLASWVEGEHPNGEPMSEGYDKDENTYTMNVGQKCVECGTVTLRKKIPKSHIEKHGISDDTIDDR